MASSLLKTPFSSTITLGSRISTWELRRRAGEMARWIDSGTCQPEFNLQHPCGRRKKPKVGPCPPHVWPPQIRYACLPTIINIFKIERNIRRVTWSDFGIFQSVLNFEFCFRLYLLVKKNLYHFCLRSSTKFILYKKVCFYDLCLTPDKVLIHLVIGTTVWEVWSQMFNCP